MIFLFIFMSLLAFLPSLLQKKTHRYRLEVLRILPRKCFTVASGDTHDWQKVDLLNKEDT